MDDDLYARDALQWAEQQSDLLRRLARGEAVNAPVDWPHVIEEVADVGLAELRACESNLRLAMLHLMKMLSWPDGPTEHWAMEVGNFLAEAQNRFTASMRQRIDLDRLYAKARRQVLSAKLAGVAPRPPPSLCPFALDDLLAEDGDVTALLGKLAA